MANQFRDGFDHYGDDNTEGSSAALARALSFGWASFVTTEVLIADPAGVAGAATPDAARHGVCAMRIAVTSGSPGGARLSLPTADDEFFIHFGLFVEQYPDGSGFCYVLELLTGGVANAGRIELLPTGALKVVSEGGATLTTTAANTVVPGSWHSMQVRWKKSATVGVVQILLDNVEIVNLTAQDTAATDIAQLRWRAQGNVAGLGQFWIDDLDVCDNTGTRNNALLGDVRVATLYPRADDEQGWTAQRRTMTGNGQLGPLTGSMGLSCSDNVQFELGSGDYTIETRAKFLATPTGSNFATVAAKWREGTNERSYRLYLGGPSLNNSHLQFDISTDGTAGTVVDVCDAEFAPVIGHDYHIVVQRLSGKTVMFADGVPLNAPATDGSTYHDNASVFMLCAQQNGVGSVVANSGLNGFVDEVRITKGVARYNATGFAVPAFPLPRSVGAGDADFASVSLLLGFDTSITDESSFGRAVTSVGGSARWANDDQAPGDYKTVNNEIPRDDSFVEAPFVAAQNVLTFTGQPANNDTITVDSNVYTFKTVFVDVAGNVLIGAAVTDSIDNLVAAINGDAGAGTLYGTGTTPSDDASALNIDNDQMRVTANTPGTAGNALTATESCANAAWADTGGTLVGGLDITTPSSFLLTRLPSQTTGVKGITLVMRAKKTDTGDGSAQLSFVTADNSSANGADHALTTSYSFYSDQIDTDPSTAGALTPSSFIGARLRVDRTA